MKFQDDISNPHTYVHTHTRTSRNQCVRWGHKKQTKCFHEAASSIDLLRRYAANDKIFKPFFVHPFLASTIYNNTIKNKFDIG